MKKHLRTLYDNIAILHDKQYSDDAKHFFLYFTALLVIVAISVYITLLYIIPFLSPEMSNAVSDGINSTYYTYSNSISGKVGASLDTGTIVFAVFLAVNNFISCLTLMLLAHLRIYPKKYFRNFFDKRGNDYINKWLVYGMLTYQSVIIGGVAGICSAYLSPFILIAGILPHYVFEIYAMSFACASGFYLRDVKEHKYKEFGKIIIVLIALLLVSAFVESFISSYLITLFI